MMKKAPNCIHMEYLPEMIKGSQTCIKTENGEFWRPARPLGYFSLLLRIKLAFDVFVGNADALYWHEDDQSPLEPSK